MGVENVFSHPVDCLFILIVTFNEHKILILMEYILFYSIIVHAFCIL